MSSRTVDAQLDAYLRQLAGRLRGPRRRRARILAEVRDGLAHTVNDRLDDGCSEAQAVHAAIAEFGGPEAVADAFAGELATAYARRTVAAYIATGPLVGIWWLLLLHPHPWRAGLIGLIGLVVAIPVIPLIPIAIATAATTLVTTGRLIRWLPEISAQRALTATRATAIIAIAGDLAVLTLYARSGIPVQPIAVLAIAASTVRIAISAVVIRTTTAMRHAMNSDTREPAPTDGSNARR